MNKNKQRLRELGIEPTLENLLKIMPGRNKYWEIENKWSNDWWLRIDQSWAEHTRRNPNGSMINTWYVNYYNDYGEPLVDELKHYEDLSDALADLLVYLIDNKLYDIDE